METNGNPKIIIETMLDHITLNTARNQYGNGGGGYFDSDNNNNNNGGNNNSGAGGGSSFMPALNMDDMNNNNRSGNNGSVGFENDGTNPAAEEFKSPWTHFEGVGYNSNNNINNGIAVPSFLKFHGKIQNICLSKKDIIRIIQEVWEAKKAYDQYMNNLQIIQTAKEEADNLMLTSPMTLGIAEHGENMTIAQAAAANSNSNALPVIGNNSNNNNEEKKEKHSKEVTIVDSDTDSKPPSRQQRAASFRRPFSRGSTQSNNNNNPSPLETATMNNQELLNSGVLSLSLVESLPTNPSLSVFMDLFLHDKLKDKLIAVEMAYNIHDSLKRFSTLSDCRLFSAVLEDKLPAEIWDDQNNMIEKVRVRDSNFLFFYSFFVINHCLTNSV
jgi:hypothetical protein